MYILLQEGELGELEYIVDPVLIVYYCIAIGIFVATSWKRKELRLFTITFVLLTIALAFLLFGQILIETFVVLSAGLSSIVFSMYLRIKSKSQEVSING